MRHETLRVAPVLKNCRCAVTISDIWASVYDITIYKLTAEHGAFAVEKPGEYPYGEACIEEIGDDREEYGQGLDIISKHTTHGFYTVVESLRFT